MSEIKWCDVGGHAFSANDEGAREYAETTVGETGRRNRIDICGPCLEKGGSAAVFKSLVAATEEDNAD